jgi:predicted RNase H-like HicB family nuclease
MRKLRCDPAVQREYDRLAGVQGEYRGYVFFVEHYDDETTPVGKTRSYWSVDVPDIPGIITSGRTAATATANAIRAIQLHIDTLRTMGRSLPKPKHTFRLLGPKAAVKRKAR